MLQRVKEVVGGVVDKMLAPKISEKVPFEVGEGENRIKSVSVNFDGRHNQLDITPDTKEARISIGGVTYVWDFENKVTYTITEVF